MVGIAVPLRIDITVFSGHIGDSCKNKEVFRVFFAGIDWLGSPLSLVKPIATDSAMLLTAVPDGTLWYFPYFIFIFCGHKYM